MDKYTYIANAHGAYIDELYKSYKENPDSVDNSWKSFFEGFDFSQAKYGEDGASMVPDALTGSKLKKEIAVRALIHAYRLRGHLESTTNPVRQRVDRKALLDLKDFGLGEEDLKTVFTAGEELGMGSVSLEQIISRLRKIYCGNVGFEFMSIREPEVYEWFKNKVEIEFPKFKLELEEKRRILQKLNEAVVFENFLHTKYVGQKRFSLEGGESTIPALDAIISKGAELGVKEFIVGMAHRGRLNVLTNIVGKTYDEVFNEFEGAALPDETMGDGDVKYHMGFSSQIEAYGGKEVTINLMPNPSHLEAVDPVVLGNARAKLDIIYDKDPSKLIPILIHGDAALAGQGIVYEIVQMSNLKGYSVGGTIHFVINNQVGFTTDFHDARSSIYSTDISQIIEAPEIHVNGDDPEAVLFAVKLAVEFRQKYKRDIFIDMVCYRRHGHNESDEPKFTQPKLYNIISRHPNPREIYKDKLIAQGELEAKVAKAMDKEFRKMLNERLQEVKQHPLPYKKQVLESQWKEMRRSVPEDFEESPDTSIKLETVLKVADALTNVPKEFKPLRQIEKLLKERKQMFFEDKSLNWAAAELLAYGSIVLENKIVRMTGQDVERGTFSHRHSILNDAETNSRYCNLCKIDENQAPFMIFNSLLSEYGVLGFEFGYSFANPNALVIWEAQFGDFANGAQVAIDQFISSCETKWQRMSGLVMLLPHGYEGQGPEHSNARPERFLQLSAEYNMVVANITTPANFFHLMRRQVTWEFRKPCVVMSPKSLLRHPSVVSPLEDFTHGKFQEVIDDEYAKPYNKVEKVLMCTGKIYFDLLEKQQKDKRKDVAIIRIEQLHPFPETQVEKVLSKYKNMSKLIWVQEEPVNMGYWTYLLRTYYKRKDLEIVARKPSASPATGYSKMHQEEQQKIVSAAFNR
ncbi:2-oxoglutarate dehydrogenase E1 component [Chondrinema litorale]|uniref:2-oxoglutarate dehydrogenase E1 component n=1 Tax=Chondrinema litorale TaxID=2994555 RepID=UPI002544A5BC|nr:2-oxoglutarate dehydrogenase E1 component [Chondrinema litorale]UZR93511.1 2-oxoglutarate dehydrogenase E1 component [Chondrinema litorale]